MDIFKKIKNYLFPNKEKINRVATKAFIRFNHYDHKSRFIGRNIKRRGAIILFDEVPEYYQSFLEHYGFIHNRVIHNGKVYILPPNVSQKWIDGLEAAAVAYEQRQKQRYKQLYYKLLEML